MLNHINCYTLKLKCTSGNIDVLSISFVQDGIVKEVLFVPALKKRHFQTVSSDDITHLKGSAFTYNHRGMVTCIFQQNYQLAVVDNDDPYVIIQFFECGKNFKLERLSTLVFMRSGENESDEIHGRLIIQNNLGNFQRSNLNESLNDCSKVEDPIEVDVCHVEAADETDEETNNGHSFLLSIMIICGIFITVIGALVLVWYYFYAHK